MHRHILLLVHLIALHGMAQIRIDEAIRLEGASPDERQVLGLDPIVAPMRVLTAGHERSNAYRISTPAPGPTWSTDLPGLDGLPSAGTHIWILTPDQTDGNVQVLINGNGPYPITWNGTDMLDGMTLPAGQYLSLVFDGSSFQIMNGQHRGPKDCPEGMAPVSTQFCMDVTEHAPAGFYDAILTCFNANKRLCSWSEFHSACTHAAELGMIGMTGNWEWTNNTANYGNVVRVVGSANCQSSDTGLINGPDRAYRCCYSR